MGSHPAAIALLSPKGRRVLAGVRDPHERARVTQCLEACAAALAVIDAFDVSRYEELDLALPDLHVWNRAAPAVRDVLVAVARSLETVAGLFPAHVIPDRLTEDLMLDLDAAFGAFEDGEVVPRARTGEQVDRLVQTHSDGDADPGVASLVEMLKDEILRFGRTLKNPAVVYDRWQLFGELQELKSKCSQCLEAVPAALLAQYSTANPEALFPRYHTELSRGRRLRSALVDLSVDVEVINQRLVDADFSQALELWRDLRAMLDDFAELPEYRDLWPRDKRVIIVFRAFLHGWSKTFDVGGLRVELEGFAKFLDTLREINRRPELEASDGQHLAAALAILQLGLSEETALVHIERVYGRDPALDAWLRGRRRGADAPDDALIERVGAALASVPGCEALAAFGPPPGSSWSDVQLSMADLQCLIGDVG